VTEAEVLNAWMRRAVRALNGHYESAREFEEQARRLAVSGLFVTLVAAVLTAFVLAAPDFLALRIGAAVAATLAASLGLLQTQLDLRGRAAQHRIAGSGYSHVRRDLEALVKVPEEVLESREFRDVQHLYSEVSKNAPTIPTKVWKVVLHKYPKDDEELLLRP
jgi:hypothetical protein